MHSPLLRGHRWWRKAKLQLRVGFGKLFELEFCTYWRVPEDAVPPVNLNGI